MSILRTRKKLIKAHIIPKKFYSELKEDRYLGINSKTCKSTIYQMGGYDSNILCADCDNHILGGFDKEGYRVLFSDFGKYKYEQLHPQYKIYQLNNTEFDYGKLRKSFISILWRVSISQSEEWSNINLGRYEKKTLGILKGKKEYDELFKILIYKNSYIEDLNQVVLIVRGKTKDYKKYVIQMAGYRVEIIVNSSRLTNRYKQQYEKHFLNPTCAPIIETPEISRCIYKDFNSPNV